MVDGAVRTNNYQFEHVHTDWSGLRTQMIVGLVCLFFLCLVNFIPFWQDKFLVIANNNFIDFTLYFVSCSLVALITLEIGATAGNRNGAGSAMWAALIFAISPWQAIICLPPFRISRIIGFFILLSVFCLLRCKQKTSKILAATGLTIALIGSIYFEIHHVTLLTPLKQITFTEYAFAALVLLVRVLYGALSRRTAATLVLCLLNAVICSEMLIYPGLKISAGAALAIILALACLPAVGTAPVRTNRIYASLGLTILTATAVTYELLFIGY